MNKQLFFWVLRLLVGGLFIFSGLIKVNDPVGTAIKLEEYFDVFSNDIATFFYYLKPYALPLSVFLVVSEVVLGIMLLLGVRLKQTVWALATMILFFTFLTFYSAYFNKVTDCGCFGDAIKLTPWESFTKDVILLVLISFLFYFRNDLAKTTPKWANYAAIGSLMLSLGLAIYAIQNLPFIDFRAFKIGVSIPINMQQSGPFKFTYVMKKEEKLIYLTHEDMTKLQSLQDEGYKLDTSFISNPEVNPKISDFRVWTGDNEDQTEYLFQGNKVILLSSDLKKMSDSNLDKLTELFKSLEKAPVDLIFMAAADQKEIDAVISKMGWKIQGLQADATVVKTIMRANPGIMILKDGVVLNKYHHNNTPGALEVLDLF
jgi:uncharacterized membrane protein YphA (DoxX/SURF4 family)